MKGLAYIGRDSHAAAAGLTLKQLELLKAILPKLSRVGMLLNPTNASHPRQGTQLILTGQKIGVQVAMGEASSVAHIEPAFALLARARVDAVVLFGDTFFSQQLQQVAGGALKHRLPSVYITREYAEAGGLMSYGAPILENFRRAATFVDKILKGANPTDLPFEQPTRYVLAMNMPTARALATALLAELDKLGPADEPRAIAVSDPGSSADDYKPHKATTK